FERSAREGRESAERKTVSRTRAVRDNPRRWFSQCSSATSRRIERPLPLGLAQIPSARSAASVGVARVNPIAGCKDGHTAIGSCSTRPELSREIAARDVSHPVTYAYRVLPLQCEPTGEEKPLTIEGVDPVPLPRSFIRLGFDVASRSFTPEFECS